MSLDAARQAAPAAAVAALDGLVLHPVFSRHRPGSLDPLDQGDAREQWRHLGAAIGRDPLDLESHVQRVRLACAAPLTDFAFGALVDLFMALGPRGRSLRARLLEQAEAWLAPEDAHFLHAHLDAGLSRAVALPSAPGALFHPAVVGVARMVDHLRVAAAQLSAREQAISLLEHGDLDGARDLLEQALLDEPGDADVRDELLGIYRHSRDDAAKTAMAERLQARHGQLPAGWA
ncbi:hypothetical protein [Leptothrix discophora]|uniref:Tetratricopeptide repeat protein n=1 Tax=Leptothrix discophora TaxID=89 RepID=A0ABT9G3C4_LEPDI|nr:hypothetical protein [Leptothrix discophora]MDP4300985.1 hypothetical protein [Leptothrix discophora]